MLKTILASPDDAQIGNMRIRTYPTFERNGMIWVFVGDENYKPVPPIAADLPMRVTDDPIRIRSDISWTTTSSCAESIGPANRTGAWRWRTASTLAIC